MLMSSATDVAKYILQKLGPMPAMKLQKLVYYSQAWHLVWSDSSLFADRIEAWANGPVVPQLYRQHRLMFTIDEGVFQGSGDNLTPDEQSSIDAVLKYYGDRSANELSQLTHREDPWLIARQQAGLDVGERGSVLITNSAMAEYYGGLIDA